MSVFINSHIFNQSMSVSYKTSVAVTTYYVDVPATVVAGDILVLFDFAQNTFGNPTAVSLADFSLIFDRWISGNVRAYRCWAKIAESTDTSRRINLMDGSSNDRKILLVFESTESVSAITSHTFNELVDNAAIPDQTITSSAGSAPIIALAFYRQDSATSQIMTPTEDGSVNIATLTARYKIFNGLPVDVVVSEGDGGGFNGLFSSYIEIS